MAGFARISVIPAHPQPRTTVTARDRAPPTPAAATFRIRPIMERGMMRQRISPGPDHAGPRRRDGRL